MSVDINKLMKGLAKASKSEYGSIASEGTMSSVHEYISTGTYLLNAQVSGDIYKGIPGGKFIVLAGEPGCGKTFFALSIGKNFLKSYENSLLIYVDTEHAVDQKMFDDRNMDTKRIYHMPVDSIEKYRTQLTNMVDYVNEQEDLEHVMIITDSISKLTSEKELQDIEAGDNKIDLTKQRLLKAALRVLGLKCAKKNITHIGIAHVYAVIGGYGNQKEISGGSGAKYEASYAIMLSKAQHKEGTDITGAIITSKLEKGRYTKEKTKVKNLLSFTKGLHPYYEMPEFCIEHGIWEKTGNRVQIGDKKVYIKEILKHPKQYFTEDIMNQINEKCKDVFCFGKDDEDIFGDDEDYQEEENGTDTTENTTDITE